MSENGYGGYRIPRSPTLARNPTTIRSGKSTIVDNSRECEVISRDIICHGHETLNDTSSPRPHVHVTKGYDTSETLTALPQIGFQYTDYFKSGKERERWTLSYKTNFYPARRKLTKRPTKQDPRPRQPDQLPAIDEESTIYGTAQNDHRLETVKKNQGTVDKSATHAEHSDYKGWPFFNGKVRNLNVAIRSEDNSERRTRDAAISVREVNNTSGNPGLEIPSKSKTGRGLFRRAIEKIPTKHGSNTGTGREGPPPFAPFFFFFFFFFLTTYLHMTTGKDKQQRNATQSTTPGTNATEKSHNYVPNFFQTKPVLREIILNLTKSKALKEIYKSILAWKHYGLDQVKLNKTNEVIYGRIGENNREQYQPFHITYYQ